MNSLALLGLAAVANCVHVQHSGPSVGKTPCPICFSGEVYRCCDYGSSRPVGAIKLFPTARTDLCA